MEGTAGPGALRRRSLSGRSKVGAPTGRGGDSPRRTPLLPRRVTAVPGRAPSRSRTARPPIPPTSLGRRNERQLNLASAPAGLRPPAAAKQACAAARCSRVYGHVHSLWGTAVRPSPPDGSPMAARHCSEELPGRPERQHRQTPRGERAAGSGPCAVPAARRSVRGGIGAARARPLSPHRRRRGRGPLLHYASAPDLARPRPSAVDGACPGQPGRALRGQRRPRGRDHRLVAGPRDLPAAQHFRGRGAHPPIEPRFHRLNVRRGSMSCDSRRGACQSVTTEQAQRDRQTNRSRFNRDQSTFAGTGHRLRRAAGTSFLPVFCLLAKECLWELRLVSVTGNSFRSPIARTLRDGPGGLSVESERLQPQPQGRPAATAELPWPEGWPQPGAQDAMGWLGVLFGSLLLAVALFGTADFLADRQFRDGLLIGLVTGGFGVGLISMASLSFAPPFAYLNRFVPPRLTTCKTTASAAPVWPCRTPAAGLSERSPPASASPSAVWGWRSSAGGGWCGARRSSCVSAPSVSSGRCVTGPAAAGSSSCSLRGSSTRRDSSARLRRGTISWRYAPTNAEAHARDTGRPGWACWSTNGR